MLLRACAVERRWNGGDSFRFNSSGFVTIGGATDCGVWCANKSCSCASISPANRFNIWRGNTVRSNPAGAAMSLLGPMADTVVEGTRAEYALDVLGPAAPGTEHTLLRGNADE